MSREPDANSLSIPALSQCLEDKARMLRVKSKRNNFTSTYIDFIFIGSADGCIYAVDARTAKESWRYKTEHQVSSSPVIYKDSLYCGSADGNLYCLEYRTGRLRWKFATKGPITGAPLVYDDIVYIGSTDHILYALLA